METELTETATAELTSRLNETARAFDRRLAELLPSADTALRELSEAIAYALLGPGKRIRPALTVHCCELLGGRFDDAFHAAAAVEMVHAFSLVHDDLPAMDDDDLRRGRPTCHRRFGEAMAILAGDALLTLAFETLAGDGGDPHRTAILVGLLARATGAAGMIGGQAADMLGETQPANLDSVRRIHRYKTAALFEAAARMGAVCAGGSDDKVAALGRFGQHLGLAFQIADDLLDVASDPNADAAGQKDDAHGKQTYPRCVGIQESEKLCVAEVEAAIAELSGFGANADELRALARFAGQRNR